jgi:hypothetical protein
VALSVTKPAASTRLRATQRQTCSLRGEARNFATLRPLSRADIVPLCAVLLNEFSSAHETPTHGGYAMSMEFPIATTPSPGVQGVDWEERVDFERLRQYRLERTRRALERSGLGALLLFETSNIRYVT